MHVRPHPHHGQQWKTFMPRPLCLPPCSAVKGCPGSYICHTLLGNKIMSKNVLPFLLGTDECSLIFKLKLMLKRNIFYVCITFTSEKQLKPVAKMLIFHENSCCYGISGLAACRKMKSSCKACFSS